MPKVGAEERYPVTLRHLPIISGMPPVGFPSSERGHGDDHRGLRVMVLLEPCPMFAALIVRNLPTSGSPDGPYDLSLVQTRAACASGQLPVH